MLLLAASVILTALLCSDAQSQPSVVPANCNDVEKDAGLALDLINKHRRDGGYIFSLLRVANAHVQDAKDASILYLTLDVMETKCPVLSRKNWTSCDARRFFAITDFGQCKAILYIKHGFQREKLYGYNCTVSPVPPKLYECVDCPVRISVIQDVDQHAGEAERIWEDYKQKSNETNYFKVEKIQKVFKAEASRTGYIIEFIIKEAKCPSNGLLTNASKCEFLPDGYARRGFCTGKVVYGTEEGDLAEAESCEIYDIPNHHHGHGCRCPLPGSPQRHPHHHHSHHHHHHHPHHHHHHHHHHRFGHRHGHRRGNGCPEHYHNDPKGPMGHHNSSEDSQKEYPDFPPPPGPHHPPPPPGGPHHLPPSKYPPPPPGPPHHHHHHSFGHHGHQHGHECPPCPDDYHHGPKEPMSHHNSSENHQEYPDFPPPPGPHHLPPPPDGPHHLPPSKYPPPQPGLPPPPSRHHDHPQPPSWRGCKHGDWLRCPHDRRCNRTSHERGKGSSHEEDLDSFRDLNFFYEIGSVYRIPVLSEDGVLEAPSAIFPDHPGSSQGRHRKHHFPSKEQHEKPTVQHFPEILSGSCPGDPKYDPLGVLALYPPPLKQ